MADINYIKTNFGLAPATEADWELHNRYKLGVLLKGKFTETRNGKFHGKFFSMLDVGYEAWEPEEINTKWGKPEKNREQFRTDVIIKAGYYEMSIRLDGSVRFNAKSISFANMQQDEFEKVYSNVANVILQSVLTKYTRDDLDNVVNQILGYV